MSEQMQSEIAQLSGQLDQLDDPRECYALVQERIRSYRSTGDRVPDALSQMERSLMRECMAESQGR
jgi:hypothetical protein